MVLCRLDLSQQLVYDRNSSVLLSIWQSEQAEFCSPLFLLCLLGLRLLDLLCALDLFLLLPSHRAAWLEFYCWSF